MAQGDISRIETNDPPQSLTGVERKQIDSEIKTAVSEIEKKSANLFKLRGKAVYDAKGNVKNPFKKTYKFIKIFVANQFGGDEPERIAGIHIITRVGSHSTDAPHALDVAKLFKIHKPVIVTIKETTEKADAYLSSSDYANNNPHIPFATMKLQIVLTAESMPISNLKDAYVERLEFLPNAASRRSTLKGSN